MNTEQDKQIRHKLARSGETFEEAEILAKAGSWNVVVNRLYYAAFYAVSALLVRVDTVVKTHSSQKSKFNELFLLTEKINRDVGNVYNILFNYRMDSDYNDYAVYTKDATEPLIERTKKLIEAIKILILQ